MSRSDHIIEAARQLAERIPLEQITYAAIAEIANVHWTTVRRHLGGKEELRSLLDMDQDVPQQQNSDARTRVMDAAVQVFARYGYAGATMDQVAKEAGQTKSVVYWHFANKCDLYLAICERNLRMQARMLPSQAEAVVQAEDQVGALAAWLHDQLAECLGNPGRPLLFFEFYTSSRDPTVREKMQRLFEEFYAHVTEMFRAFQERKLIRADIEAQSLTVYVQTVLNGIMLSWMLAPKGMRLDQFALDAAKMLWNGLSASER